MVYVIGHDKKVVGDVVSFLQHWKPAGVIFTRDAIPATFPLKAVHLDSPEAPDIVISLRWSTNINRFGVPGAIVTDGASYKPGQGAHVNNRTPEMDPVARTAAGWCLSSRVGRLRRAAACRIVRRYNAAEGGARRPLRPIHAGQAGEVEAVRPPLPPWRSRSRPLTGPRVRGRRS